MSRSSLIFAAVEQMPSRFQLVQQTAKGARRLHRGERMRTTRMADTLNEVLIGIAGLRRAAEPVHLGRESNCPEVDGGSTEDSGPVDPAVESRTVSRGGF